MADEKNKILYVHGLGGGANGRISNILRNEFPEYEIDAPEIPIKPKEALEFVNDLIRKTDYDVVIGSSLGAYYLMYCRLLPKKVLINPAIGGGDYIEKFIGKGEQEFRDNREDGSKTYIIDDDFINDLNDMKYYLDEEDDVVTRVVISDQDELFGSQNVDRCKEIYADYCISVIHSSHSVEDSIVVGEVVPVIKDLIEFDVTKTAVFIGPYLDFDDIYEEDWVK